MARTGILIKTAIPLLLLGCPALLLQAAVIRGTVIEKRTGYSLSRATVTLEPVPSAGQTSRTVRTSESGAFEFTDIGAGSYLIKASRRGFMPMEYGQKRWNSAGAALTLDSDATMSLHLALSRYGAIVGTVRDSNEVGIPDQDVAAYTNTQPPRFFARAKSDDRGVFRIGGLEPGTWLVRTTGGNEDDRSYLPTFARETLRVEEARPVVVYPDEDANDGDVRPIAGKLFDLTGFVALPSQPPFAVVVTLASDMGRVTSMGPVFHFPALAPGRYEIYAEAREAAPGTKMLGGYTEILIERNLMNYALPVNEVRESQFTLEGAGNNVSTVAWARRKDLTGVGEPMMLTTPGRTALFPGRWEFLATPPNGYYVSRFSGSRNTGARPEGWNEILVNYFSRFAITVSTGPGGLHGTVKSSNAAAAAAPVFLETWDPITRRRLADLRETRSDMRGNYRFEGLAPGEYRVLSTYEYAAPDPNAFDAAGAQAIRIEASTNPQLDLELYGIP